MRRRVLLATLLSLSTLMVLARTTLQVREAAGVDEAKPADVIVIFGAAEYYGRPSPVLRARLDHGLALYQRQLAPRTLTTGGPGGDPVFTEADVGRDYLIRRKVPPEAIIVEPEASTTAQSVAAVYEIMRRMDLRSCIVVTDGYHVFRVKKMLERRGVQVYASPRPGEPGGARLWWLCFRQALAYWFWRMGIVI